MLTLNLLPPEEKTRVAYVLRTRAVAALGLGFVGVMAVGTVLLLPTLFFLVFQKSDTVRAAALEREGQAQGGITREAKRLSELDRKARASLAASDRGEPMMALLEAVIADVPAAVRIQSLEFERQAREISLVGFAPTRAALLALIRTLEANPKFLGVSSPVTNFIREVDVRFSLTVKIRGMPSE